MKNRTKRILKSSASVLAGISYIGLLTTVTGFCLGFIGFFKSDRTLKNYKQSDEYKSAISQELIDLKNNLKNESANLDILENYSTSYIKILSDSHAIDLLQKSDSQFAKDQKEASNAINFGRTSITAGIPVTIASTLGMSIIANYIDKKDDELDFSDLELQQ